MQRVVGLVLVLFACSPARTATPAADEPRSLLQTIAEWQYPGSALTATQASDGETVDAKGDRTVPSTVSRTVMTTDAPVEEVLGYYRAKLSPAKKADGSKPGPPVAGGRSVAFSDDSEGRPFALHTVIINTSDASTTLVISRGKDEARTYIAWKQYRRFDR
ncbi:hypothetical protein P12x_004666 [Tundrisphaera lichenicola]|uniref:hypothetical protein n=1 Tax=Tundrisphaera lichenicola TaxID=2029860 RepID=UPI003EBA7435